MTFRKTEAADLDGVMEIVRQAQASLKARGIDQWQNGYPDRPAIEADIARGWSYVLADGERVLGTTAISFAGEPTYDTIYQGAWGTEAPEYAFLHRIAVSGACKGKGVPSLFFQELERQARERGLPCLRGDTHRENKIMQRVMEKNGLSYRGVIYLEDGGERLAFEKVL